MLNARTKEPFCSKSDWQEDKFFRLQDLHYLHRLQYRPHDPHSWKTDRWREYNRESNLPMLRSLKVCWLVKIFVRTVLMAPPILVNSSRKEMWGSSCCRTFWRSLSTPASAKEDADTNGLLDRSIMDGYMRIKISQNQLKDKERRTTCTLNNSLGVKTHKSYIKLFI